MSFFWYDYETWGKSPFLDRIVQFGGVRTNDDLEQTGKTIQLYCQPGLDTPIGPGAVNIHGVMPMEAHKHGLPESEFATRIHTELSRGDTCSVAYNGMKFDHDFTRGLFYRNLRDPYAWAWKNENTYWDTLDLIRAAFLLIPEALQHWPKKEGGAPSFKLEDLSDANLKQDQISKHHDAVSDSVHMWLLAKLIREQAGELWDHALTLRYKWNVEEIMNRGRPVLYVAGKIHTDRHCATLISPLGVNKQGKIYGFDLSFDPEPFLKPYGKWTPEDKVQARDSIRSLKYKRSPFVCEWSEIEDLASPAMSMNDILDKMRLTEGDVQARHAMIREYTEGKARNSLAKYIQTMRMEPQVTDSLQVTDPDEAIYEGFFSEYDRQQMNLVREQGPKSNWRAVHSSDQRVEPLVFRYIARNFPEVLNDDEKTRWYAYCRNRLLEHRQKRWVTADQVFSYELRDSMEPWGNLGEGQIKELLRWQDGVRERLLPKESG